MSITTIKFQALPEDYIETREKRTQIAPRKRKNTTESIDTNYKDEKTNREVPHNGKNKPNFSLQYSYPAVIFDKVCFSVDKSQQQANFMKECLFRLQNCPLIGSLRDESDSKVHILKSVNLSVPYGSIFGLLGPSSCGKTTLLRCLVGLLKPTSGSICLFGHNLAACRDGRRSNLPACRQRQPPRRRQQRRRRQSSTSIDDDVPSDWPSEAAGKCQVPGVNVGYMPQDLGLYEDFTIRQILTMFGRYMRMNSDLIVQRIDFMAQFLELPEIDRRIESLSGGQKRRVSFAIACLHMPPLIILDEPTVGVDPLLRQSIWKYLRRLADEENKTIIITTHYIEEAAQADQVALMRAGEILVQDTPSKIMQLNQSKTLEEAFLRICNNVKQDEDEDEVLGVDVDVDVDEERQLRVRQAPIDYNNKIARFQLYPQPKFNWNQLGDIKMVGDINGVPSRPRSLTTKIMEDGQSSFGEPTRNSATLATVTGNCKQHNAKLDETINRLSMAPNITASDSPREVTSTFCHQQNEKNCTKLLFTKSIMNIDETINHSSDHQVNYSTKTSDFKMRTTKMRLFKRSKFVLNDGTNTINGSQQDIMKHQQESGALGHRSEGTRLKRKMLESFRLIWALIYKNYRRNVNSLPLLAFQFMLPVIQMISFSLCVGGRPSNIGLGLVNLDQPISISTSPSLLNDPFNATTTTTTTTTNSSDYAYEDVDELLSLKYLSFLDRSMLQVNNYEHLKEALADVRRGKLWAVMEIGQNFTTSISKRFDFDNFYQLDFDTISQSIIRLYPDRSNKILDMICHRSLVNSYRQFLLAHFEHFKRLPIEIREPIFDIKPNAISNSIDGYTESIAPGLLASLTYIMAAGLTTFIMVVERSAGILERTYTSGINPISYLLAHAIFRSVVMMLQIGIVLILTFYVLKQPLVGSIWLAYSMLMTLNITGIAYGLLISSIVTDQNGAALTIVSSLVVKITMSGILWPFEAIPNWLRYICYVQPLTMPVQALKAITLKGSSLGDRAVNLGFLVSIFWFIVFLTIAAKRFRFYQH